MGLVNKIFREHQYNGTETRCSLLMYMYGKKLFRSAGHSSKCIVCDPRFPIYRSFMLLYIHKIQVSLISEHKFLYIPEYSGTSTNVVPGSQVFFSGTQHLTGHADDWHFYVCNANIILCIRITLTNLSHRLLIRHLRRSARWPWRISYRIPSHISSRGRRRLNDNSPESLHKSVKMCLCHYVISGTSGTNLTMTSTPLKKV